MTGNQDSLASSRDDARLLLWDLACIAGTLSEIATVWRRARPYLPELPALVPEQLADAARHLASVIESLAEAGLLKPYAQAASLVEQSSALQQGIASAQAMTSGDGVPDLGDARLWESLRGPVRRAARQITELAPEPVTTTDLPGRKGVAPRQLPGSTVGPLVVSAGPADRACCCPAESVVRVVLPPGPTRAHTTDLLLCARHYRMSRHAFIAAEAAICELPGIPGDVAAWIDTEAPEPDVSPADQ